MLLKWRLVKKTFRAFIVETLCQSNGFLVHFAIVSGFKLSLFKSSRGVFLSDTSERKRSMASLTTEMTEL